METGKCQAQKYICAPRRYVSIITQKHIRQAIGIDFYFCIKYNEIRLEWDGVLSDE
jgi:hypothetical protein